MYHQILGRLCCNWLMDILYIKLCMRWTDDLIILLIFNVLHLGGWEDGNIMN